MFEAVREKFEAAGGSFRYREFRLFYVAAVGASMGNQIQRITDLWLVFELTRSPFYTGLTGLARGIPIIVFSLVGGIIADRIDRRKFVILMQSGNAAACLVMAALIATESVRVWHIYLISMLSSAFVALSAPARTAMTPELVPREYLVNAFAFTSTAWKLAQLIGPALAGIMIASLGSGTTYGFNGGVYIASFLVLAVMHYSSRSEDVQKSAFKSLIEGLSFVRSESIIAVLVSMDVVAVYFGSYRALLPVLADNLDVGSEGLGLFQSAIAAGALVGAGLIMMLGDLRYKGLWVAGAILGYALSLSGLAFSSWFPLSLFIVALLGFFDSMQAIPRNTLIQSITPDPLRGRVSSFQRMLSVGAPGLGETQSGAIASIVGPPLTLVLGSMICAGSILGILGIRRDLWRRDL